MGSTWHSGVSKMQTHSVLVLQRHAGCSAPWSKGN